MFVSLDNEEIVLRCIEKDFWTIGTNQSCDSYHISGDIAWEEFCDELAHIMIKIEMEMEK